MTRSNTWRNLLVGGSCGMAVVAALRDAEKLTKDDVVVVLLPDGGRGYLNKIFSDKWMADYGFLGAAGGGTVGELLQAKGGTTPSLVHTHPNETVREAMLTPTDNIERTVGELRTPFGPSARVAVLPEGPQTVPYVAEVVT